MERFPRLLDGAGRTDDNFRDDLRAGRENAARRHQSFVYQTDATGRYSTTGGDNRNTRLHGITKTERDGRYEFRTIKPASYPDSRIPAHVHAYVSGPDYPEYWIDEYHFADDPFVTSEMKAKDEGKGNRSSIMTLTRGADGVLRGVRDIVIERCSKNCTGR